MKDFFFEGLHIHMTDGQIAILKDFEQYKWQPKERTEEEKVLDRFLEGFHPRLTPMQDYMFKDLTRKFKKWNDRSQLIICQGPYDETNSWINEFAQTKERIMDDNKGLYHKFDVFVRRTGEKIEDGKAFVLLPEKDEAAVAALKTYADEVRKEAPELASDIYYWLARIHEGKMGIHPLTVDWAKDFFAKGLMSTTNGSGQDLVLIEAGPRRGKTTLGIIAGIKYWESHATYPPTTGMGFIVTLSLGQTLDVVMPLLVDKFHATVTCRDQNIVSIPTKTGHRTIRICAIDSSALEGSHLHDGWLFVDNIDLIHPQTKVWRVTDRLDPKMLIFSQSVHTFASSILANKNEWNVLTDPTLL